MKNIIRQIVSASLILFYTIAGTASGEDCLQKLFPNFQRSSSSIDARGKTFYVRAYPFRPVELELAHDKSALLDSIITIDSSAMLAERNRSNTRARPEEDFIKYPYLVSKTPDSVFWMRGNEVAIFPRILLFAPKVASAKVHSNDFIATMYLRESSISDPEEVIWKWFKSEIRDNKREMNTKAANARIISPSREESREVGGSQQVFFSPFYADKNKEWIDSIGSEVDSKLVVVVLHRNWNGHRVHCIVPYKQSGGYAINGQRYTDLLSENAKTKPLDQKDEAWNMKKGQRWDTLFSPYDMALRHMDVVEFTTIEKVSMFRPSIR